MEGEPWLDTFNDKLDLLKLGSLQHLGDNLISLLLKFFTSPHLQDMKAHKDEGDSEKQQIFYFDVVVADTWHGVGRAADKVSVDYDSDILGPPILSIENARNKNGFSQVLEWCAPRPIEDLAKGMLEAYIRNESTKAGTGITKLIALEMTKQAMVDVAREVGTDAVAHICT